MKSLVIFDTYFGNTKKIAEEIANQLKTTAVNVCGFNNSQLEDLELIIVGSPTRAFGPTENMKKFLKKLPEINGIKIVAFDTRMDTDKAPSEILKFMAKRFGFAAEKIEKKLIKKGGEKVLGSKGFYVNDMEGPLGDSEIGSVKDWIAGIK